MNIFSRFKFFLIGIFFGSILVFFFFGDKVKDWFFIIHHPVELLVI